MMARVGPGWLGLASQSPRRARLLDEAGFDAAVIQTDVDDSELHIDQSNPPAAAMALAWFKAAAGIEQAPEGCRIVIGADTFVVKDGAIIGKARDEADADMIIRRLSDGRHDVITGVAIVVIDASNRTWARRRLFADRAGVRVGDITSAQREEYIQSEQWRGKAGAYNFIERIAAGWPLHCDDDLTTVMGLPMKKLTPMLHELAQSEMEAPTA